jgi:hypothetical protein
MKTHTYSQARFLFIMMPLVLMCLFSGCKRSDILLVTQGNLAGREGTIGKVFDTCPLFTQVSWDRIKDNDGNRTVVFIAEIYAPDLLRTVASDENNWLNMEKRYFESVSADVQKACIKVTFPLNRPEFSLQDIMLGISTPAKTVWSPALNDAEKEGVLDAIYENNDLFFPLLAPYANPSFKKGSTLFHELTGKKLTDFFEWHARK